MLPSLDNFVSFGSDIFKARSDYRQMALDIYTTSVTSEHLGENDAVNGCKLAESLLLNLRGHIDEVFPFVFLLIHCRANAATLGPPNHHPNRAQPRG